MGRVISRLLPGFLCVSLLCSGNVEAVWAGESLVDAWERQNQEGFSQGNTGDGREENPSGEQNYNEVPQLKEEDIYQMNQGNAAFLYNDQGYVSFLRGRFFDEKVTDTEKGVESLMGIADLLGLSKGSEFFAVYGEQDEYGYTYLTYKQRYGDLTLENASLKIILDPEGYTAGLVSSFAPNVGIAPEEESSITAQNAEKIIQDYYGENDIKIYTEYTRQTSVTVQGVAYHAWAVFTNLPAGEAENGGKGYLEHLIAYDGSYLTYVAVSSPQEQVMGDNAQLEMALSYFDGLTGDTYTGEITLHDGTKKNISVPVAYDSNGTYYLADVNRHIFLADYYSFNYNQQFLPWTSGTNRGWPDHYLSVYDSYIKVYDFYKKYGLTSVDGFGTPLLILTDYCDSTKNPVNNAVYLGMCSGWAVFSASAVNDFGECIDVAAHEFTHGITDYASGGNLYQNQSGAVNEGISDVCGNLCEMLLGATTDETWLLGENSGSAIRCMSAPWMYGQPSAMYDSYYYPETDAPNLYNDYGGVHINSSLIGYVGYQLCNAGMTKEQAFGLWMGALRMMTPKSGYQEVHQALKFAADIRGMDNSWQYKIDSICGNVGY